MQVFPSVQALTVEQAEDRSGVILTQHDETEGRDVSVWIPLQHVSATCAAIKMAAKSGKAS